MHELSIAVDLVDVASAELARLGSGHVTAVRLRLGPLSGVVKDALHFSFEVAAAGTPLDGARLQIEDIPVSVWCAPCDAQRDLPDVTKRRCPVCDSPAPHLVRGDELELIGLEIEDA